jgi:uncharacterized cupin superfamily protein
MKELSVPGFYSFSVFSSAKQMDFNGYFWRRKGGNVLIDPPVMSDADIAHAKELGGVRTCVLTNFDHLRDAKRLRDVFGFEVVCHPADKEALGFAEAQTVEEGDQVVPGMFVVHMRFGKTPGEIALWLPELATLIAGDILQGAPVGSIKMPADSKLSDPPRAALEIRKLLALPFERLLVGDGHSLFGHSREAVLRCLEARDDIELHQFDPGDMDWAEASINGRFHHVVKRVSHVVGARKLAYNLRRLPPGGSTGPMHYHHAEEELFVVLEGGCTLETLRGPRELKTGSFVCCPPGEQGAHTLVNRTKEPCVVLCLSDVVPHDTKEQTGIVDFRGDLMSP